MSERNYPNKFKSRLKTFGGQPDLSPMLSMIFLLLLFFIISSTFVQTSGIKVDLPEVSTKGTFGVEKCVITLAKTDAGSEIYFNDKVVSKELLKRELAEVANLSSSATVILRADSKTPFAAIAEIMAIAEATNLSVFIATVPPKKKTEAISEGNE